MRRGSRELRTMLLTMVLLAVAAGSAMAHKINVFATNIGAEVEGEVYASASSKIAGAKVHVLAPDGSVLIETTTDEKGCFRFTAPCRADLKIEVKTGDGHSAHWPVPAADLPASLPGWNEGEGESPTAVSEESVVSSDTGVSVSDGELLRQIASLKRQIQGYEDTVRFHDILGGIGYIVGLAGVAFYFTARKSGGENTGTRQDP